MTLDCQGLQTAEFFSIKLHTLRANALRRKRKLDVSGVFYSIDHSLSAAGTSWQVHSDKRIFLWM